MCLEIMVIFQQLHLIDKEKLYMGLTAKPVGKMRSIIRKLENQLAKETKLQKEKKESKKDKNK